jgi:hypothetical protein
MPKNNHNLRQWKFFIEARSMTHKLSSMVWEPDPLDRAKKRTQLFHSLNEELLSRPQSSWRRRNPSSFKNVMGIKRCSTGCQRTITISDNENFPLRQDQWHTNYHRTTPWCPSWSLSHTQQTVRTSFVWRTSRTRNHRIWIICSSCASKRFRSRLWTNLRWWRGDLRDNTSTCVCVCVCVVILTQCRHLSCRAQTCRSREDL